jgi:hypothetical protein
LAVKINGLGKMLNYNSVYGDNYDEESELVGNGKASETSKKRKAIAENAVKESASYDWSELADNGKVMLKVYLVSCFNPVASSGPKKKKKFSLF